MKRKKIIEEVIAKAKATALPTKIQLGTTTLTAKNTTNGHVQALPTANPEAVTAIIEAAKKLSNPLCRVQGAQILDLKNFGDATFIPYTLGSKAFLSATTPNEIDNDTLLITVIELIEKHQAPNVSEAWVTIEIRRVFEHRGDASYVLRIRQDNLRAELPRKIISHFPQLLLDANIDKKIANAYDLAISTCSVTHEFYFGGWEWINRKLVFLNNEMPNVSCKYRLKHDIELAKRFLPAYLDICEPEHRGKLLIALLFALYASAAVLWDEARISEKGLRSACYLAAPTGTGKTTLAKILANAITEEKDCTILRFEDTQASLEESILANRDMVTVVDDFFAQGTKLGDAAYKAKASSITRIAGDGRLKGKMGPDRKPLPDRKYRGCLIMTGEFVDLNTFSSFLRCWQLRFPAGSIKFKSSGLQELSGNGDIARAFFSAWIRCIEEKHDMLIERLGEFIDGHISIVRDRFPGCKHARFHANVAALLIIGKLFQEFLNSHLGDFDIDVFGIIMDEAYSQLNFLREIEPHETFRRAFQEAIDNGKVSFANNSDDFLVTDGACGYFEGDSIFIVSSHVEIILSAYCSAHELGLKLTSDLKAELVQRRILAGVETVKFSRNRKVAPKRPRLYELCRYAFEI